jgi:hypothetical protein
MMYQNICAFLALVIIGLVIAIIILASKTKEKYRFSAMPTPLPPQPTPQPLTSFRPIVPIRTPIPSKPLFGSSQASLNAVNWNNLYLPLIGVCKLNLTSNTVMPVAFPTSSMSVPDIVKSIQGNMIPQLGSLYVDVGENITEQDGANLSFILNGFSSNCVDPNHGTLSSKDLSWPCNQKMFLNFYGTFDVKGTPASSGPAGCKGTVVLKIPTSPAGDSYNFVAFMVCQNQLNPDYPPIEGYC